MNTIDNYILEPKGLVLHSHSMGMYRYFTLLHVSQRLESAINRKQADFNIHDSNPYNRSEVNCLLDLISYVGRGLTMEIMMEISRN